MWHRKGRSRYQRASCGSQLIRRYARGYPATPLTASRCRSLAGAPTPSAPPRRRTGRPGCVRSRCRRVLGGRPTPTPPLPPRAPPPLLAAPTSPTTSPTTAPTRTPSWLHSPSSNSPPPTRIRPRQHQMATMAELVRTKKDLVGAKAWRCPMRATGKIADGEDRVCCGLSKEEATPLPMSTRRNGLTKQWLLFFPPRLLLKNIHLFFYFLRKQSVHPKSKAICLNKAIHARSGTSGGVSLPPGCSSGSNNLR